MDSSAVPAFTLLNPCSGHGLEDFQYQLVFASMELQKIKADGRLQESKLWRLQELLNMMTKERDEAREECKRLQECLLLQNTTAMGMDSPSSFMLSSSMVSSPSSSAPWSLQELEEHLNNDDFCSSAAVPTSFELQQALESFSQSCDDGQHIQSLFSDGKPSMEQVHTGSHQQFHMDQALCFDALPCFNVSELQKDVKNGAASSSVRALSRQSSSNSTSAKSVQCFQHKQCSVESLEDTTALSPAFTEAAGMVTNAPPSLSSTENHVMYAANQALLSSLLMDSNGSCVANAPASMPSLSANGSCVTDNALSVTSYMGNNEAALAMPIRPSMCDKVASAAMCPMPSMDNFMAPLGADKSLPVLSSVGDHASSTIVSIPSPTTTSTTVRSAATPTSSAGNSVASLMPSSTINPPAAKVSMDTDSMLSPPSKDSSPSATISNPKIASPTARHAASVSPPSAPRCNQQGISAPVRQVHLPEPPEADPQVMLNSLPEKGKLLQAVMQAGPLLQTLLLAGPLPQWRHPPPALSTGDIPKVSLAPITVLSPYTSHMSSPVVKGSFPNNKGPFSTITMSRRRPANTESCARNKKLRKLSPLPTKQGLAMHMLTRRDEQRLAAGS